MRIEDLTPAQQDALIKSGQLDGDPARIAELKQARRVDFQSDGCVPAAGLPPTPPGRAPAYLTKPRPESELDQLRRWKSEALAVERSWDVQAIARLLDLKLGANIRAAIQPAIERLMKENDHLRSEIAGIEDDFMTSKTHHPGYVLIPIAKFDALRAAASLSIQNAKAD